jgi:hypothetical protein
MEVVMSRSDEMRAHRRSEEFKRQFVNETGGGEEARRREFDECAKELAALQGHGGDEGYDRVY